MADCFVLNDILCFLSNKLKNSPDRLIRNVLLDFYDDATLSRAKYQLKTDIEKLELPTGVVIPHVPDRREGDQRVVRVIDDILTLLKFLDTNLLLTKLPTYVTDNPDKIPSMRIFEGDLATIMTMIGKLNDKMSDYERNISAIGGELTGIKSSLCEPVQAILHKLDHYTIAGQCNKQSIPVDRFTSQSKAETHVKSIGHTAHDPAQTVDRINIVPRYLHNSVSEANTASQSEQNFSRSQDNVNISSIHDIVRPLTTVTDWAASSSSPVAQHNMFEPLMSAGSETDEPFTEVISNRTRRARRRRESSDHQQHTATVNANTVSTANTRRPGSRILMGSAAASCNNNNNVIAAKSLRKPRVVLYVDNLSKDCTPDELSAFVSGLSVEVFSCFKVEPRHRRGTAPDKQRTAFRLCVAKDDLDRVLEPSLWPDSIVVSEWVHKKPNLDQAQKRSRLGDTNTRLTDAVTGESQSSSSVVDMDTTVIYNAPSTEAKTDNGELNAAATFDTNTDNSNNQDGSVI